MKGPKKKTSVAVLISDKIDFKLKLIIRDWERHYILIKEKSIIAILSIYVQNTRTLKFTKHKNKS